MRSIKFRQWTGEEMSYWLGHEPGDIKVTNINEFFEEESNIMQYTGLKDKNGKEIYDLDILSCTRHGWIGVVKWRAPAFWVIELAGEPSGEESQWSLNVNLLQYKIIGNFYENPELLK